MATNKILSMLVLYPISKVYGWVMGIRNTMFDHDWMLHEHSFDIPVITVGNISMGGAGKTPHTEYIVNSLLADFHIGVLSRGYKRKTKGFVLASPHSHVDDIGDEPYQIYHKFRRDGVMVAVCENRVEGIQQMREADPKLNLIVLDDAFQHRYVKPTVSVVLMEYNRPAFKDHLLPFGRLREPMSALRRADIVVVTKCPGDTKPMDYRIFTERLGLFPYQKLFFSRYSYQAPVPMFPEAARNPVPSLSHLTRNDSILIVAGVANPRPFVRYIRTFKAKVKIKHYADHHHFTHSDMNSILAKFEAMPGNERLLITTEKDAVRLINNPYFPPQLRACSYYIPIKVELVNASNESLENDIRQLIRTNKTLK